MRRALARRSVEVAVLDGHAYLGAHGHEPLLLCLTQLTLPVGGYGHHAHGPPFGLQGHDGEVRQPAVAGRVRHRLGDILRRAQHDAVAHFLDGAAAQTEERLVPLSSRPGGDHAPGALIQHEDDASPAIGDLQHFLQRAPHHVFRLQGLPQDVAESVQGEELAIALDQVLFDTLHNLKDEPEEEGDAQQGDGSRHHNGHPGRSERFDDDYRDRFQGQEKGRRDDDGGPSQTSGKGLHLASLPQA